MTETVDGPTTSAGAGAPDGGLTMERVFSTAGVHPYDELEWEHRDVVQTNWKTGEAVFEQRGVEFPATWSLNASTIVTTKYFRGALGTPQRESSLKHLIDRVVRTYVKAGREHGYFATEADAEVFEHELTWLLVNQYFSFNSPVWFNVGTQSPQQVSACQPYDALVSTPAGLVEIGKLVEDDAVGTKVYDAHGLTRVLATKANGVKDVLRVHTKAGYVLDVTADHLVWKATGDGLFDGEFIESGALTAGDTLLHVDPEMGGRNTDRLEVDRIEELGAMEVYDIQTESGEYLSGNLRVHNCFILSVDDSMDSILNWYSEEGIIFKGGSGAGLNLSRIRSSKELLSSGGTASGPVSFMRGADASAGTIKSGGATRRAAKMVVLDVDHPDIEEFVETKAREEDKIRALRDAGFDMDLGGDDIISVQYQNANNSVRVTDEFMRAVEEGTEFGLRSRTTGEVVDTVDARDLFQRISRAAWECADPGVQYDSTINDWHTNPETGRITASNPCFTADTLVHTDQGLIRFDELLDRANAGEQFGIYTHDATNVDEPAHAMQLSSPEAFMITGRNPVVRLRFDSGLEMRSTPGHRIWTTNRGYVEAENLTGDDQVLALDLPTPAVNASWSLPEAVRDARAPGYGERREGLDLPEEWSFDLAHYLGWLIGDGTTSQTVSTIYGSAEDRTEILPRHQDFVTEVNGGVSPKVSEQLNGTAQLRFGRQQFFRFLSGLGVTRALGPDKVVPEAVMQAPEEISAEFLRGLFDADGTVVRNDQKGCYVGLGSTSRDLLLGVQRQLSTFGITSHVYQVREGSEDGYEHVAADGSLTHYRQSAGYDLRITGRSLDTFAAQIGFTLSRKAHLLSEIVENREAYNTDQTVRLVERSDEGVELTYNLSEPRNHSYVANGVVVRNCSEYMHLDNSSCNLASLNLLKFLRDDDTFDADLFAQAVEVVITAMDISVSFADFPTQAIGDTTRDYRQLGIGYANLGALLMAMGLGYDSDGGRAMAASLTSLMTGTSYRRSAELARAVGPYAGYARNAEAHQRVMRKHQAANDEVHPRHRDDTAVHDLATTEWEKVVELGKEHGFRNAQASVLAPTGTIGFMMDCDTTGIEPDFSLVKFKKLVGGGSMQIVNQTIPRALNRLGYQPEQVEAIVAYIAEHGHVIDAPGLNPEHYEIFDTAMGSRALAPMAHVRMMGAAQPFLSGAISKCVTGETLLPTENGLTRINSLHQGEEADSFRDERMEIAGPMGPQKTDAFYYGGRKPVRDVVLRSGHRISGTYNHRVLVATEGALEWKYVAELEPGDYVAQQYGAQMWSPLPASLGDFTPEPLHGNQKDIAVPDMMNDELAFLLGAFVAEGHIARRTWTVVITNADEEVLRRVQSAWQTQFGLAARIERRDGKCPQVRVASKTLVELLEHLGVGSRASDKRIPDAVLTSPREMVLSFLQGLALDAYTYSGAEQTKWAICLESNRLLEDLQSVLTNLGVVHGRISKYNTEYAKTYDEVYASGRYAQRMVELVPFVEASKRQAALRVTEREINSAGGADVVPCVSGRELYAMIPKSKSGRHGHSLRRGFTFLLDPRTTHVSFDTLQRVARVPGVVLRGPAADVIRDNLHFSPVDSVADGGEQEVYDVSVPTTHAFVGNGIVNHNTVNLPESASVEDIEDVFLQSWKLGLKATAIYRDNCKVGQPLSSGKGENTGKADDGSTQSGAEAEPEVVEKVVYAPTRKRLPKSRASRTTSFTVGGAEGYMTSGAHEDGELGEVFLKLGKQGSTLAGVMDAFSIAVSIGLQYGVPLETYVSKFTNLRFEPAGLTDDPDVRMAQSMMDYIFRRLALDYLPFEKRSALGIYSADERQRHLETGSYEPLEETGSASELTEQPRQSEARSGSGNGAAGWDAVEDLTDGSEVDAPEEAGGTAHTSAELMEQLTGTAVDSPLCFTCGTKMRPAGSCFVCEGCGSTSGCS